MIEQLKIIIDDSDDKNNPVEKQLKIGTVLRNKKSKKEFIVVANKIDKEIDGSSTLNVAMLDEIECETCGKITKAIDFPKGWFPKNIWVATIKDGVAGIERPDHKSGYRFNIVKCPPCGEGASLDENWKLVCDKKDNKKQEKE